MNTNIVKQKIQRLEEIAITKYIKNIPWLEIVNMLSQKQKDEYYSLLSKLSKPNYVSV